MPMKMPKYDVPRWIKITAALVPTLATLFAVGSWANEKWMAQTFVTQADASETNDALVKRMEAGEQSLAKRMESGEQKDAVQSIEIRLEIINVEINWLASVNPRNVTQNERLNLLREQQRILMERYQTLQTPTTPGP